MPDAIVFATAFVIVYVTMFTLRKLGVINLNLKNDAVELKAKSAETAEAVVRKADAAVSGQLNFQTPATEIMEKIVDLHNDLFFFIVVVVLFVS